MSGQPAVPSPIAALLRSMPRSGRVTWISVRPARGAPVEVVDAAEARIGNGLVGDHYAGGAASRRQLTLFQCEHLAVIAGILGRDSLDPALLRRNLAVAGINVYALRDARFRVGAALLEGSGVCAPCSRMEQALGAGGYNAMRGHGGITARVLEPGVIRVGSPVTLVAPGAAGERQSRGIAR